MTTSWTPQPELPARAGVEFSSSADDRRPSPGRQRWFLVGLSVAVVLAVVGAVLVRSGSTDQAEAITFRYGFQPGEVRTYDFRMSMDMKIDGIPDEDVPEVNGTMTATMVMRVEEVREDGSAVVDMTLANLSVDVDGVDAPPTDFPQTMQMRVTLAPNGEVLEMEGSFDAFNFSLDDANPLLGGAAPTGQSNSQMFFPAFPEAAVAPGESWSETTEVPFPFGDEVVTLTLDGKHLGFEDTDYGRAAKIEQKMRVPMDFSFAFGELIAGFAEGFGDAGGSVPSELRDAKMIFGGKVTGTSTSLVIPENADAVSVDAVIDMDMTIRLEDFPEMPGEEVPDEMSMKGSFDIRMRRVD